MDIPGGIEVTRDELTYKEIVGGEIEEVVLLIDSDGVLAMTMVVDSVTEMEVLGSMTLVDSVTGIEEEKEEDTDCILLFIDDEG